MVVVGLVAPMPPDVGLTMTPGALLTVAGDGDVAGGELAAGVDDAAGGELAAGVDDAAGGELEGTVAGMVLGDDEEGITGAFGLNKVGGATGPPVGTATEEGPVLTAGLADEGLTVAVADGTPEVRMEGEYMTATVD